MSKPESDLKPVIEAIGRLEDTLRESMAQMVLAVATTPSIPQCNCATKQDLRAVEKRLADLILAAHSGDPQRIQALTSDLAKSADTLVSAINDNNQKKD